MTSNPYSFTGVVRFNEQGEMVCFCYEEDVNNGLCSCKEKFDCPMAKIDIFPIAGSRPSENILNSLKSSNKEIENNLNKFSQGADKIKRGLLELEKSIKKNSHFKI